MLKRCAIALAVCLAGVMSLRAQDGCALLMESGGSLSVYNNIVVNNGDTTYDYSAWTTYNLFGYHDDIFSHIENDFRPIYHPQLFNRGYNAVVLWSFDMDGKSRMVNDTVELGAFEYPRIIKSYELGYPLYQEPGGDLSICNNIVILNIADSDVVVNVAVSSNNILSDTVDVFMNNLTDYNIRPNSIAVDGGDNSCAMVEFDMDGKPRISGSAIDIGIFEHEKHSEKPFGFTIYAEPSGNLNICNNIVLYNTADSDLNIPVPVHNLVTDSADVFFHYKNDYRIKPNSLADNTGDNSCVSVMHDIKDEERVAGAAVELGAFERLVGEARNLVAWPVFVEEGGNLNFCNNIIINNSADTNVNVPVPDHNMVTDTVAGVFRDMCRDFILQVGSPAIDAGDNSCVVTIVDLKAEDRIFGSAVDLGAFERPDGTLNVGFPFYQESDAGNLNLCNNIIINNSADSNVNVTVPPHNMVTNNQDVFIDDWNNFLLRSYSSAVDGGLNLCAMWSHDMRDTARIIHEVIDLGAFEIFVDFSNAIVYQDSTGTLTLCNNVIILNSDWVPNTNIQQIPSNNIVNDLVAVFRDNLLDFRPLQHCDAVDAGDNSCNDLPTDLDTVKRISNGCIDIGAYEIPEHIDTNNYAGGGGGGTGGGGGGGGFDVPTYNAVVYESSSSSLYLCDNIIVNSLFTANTNTSYGLNPTYRNWVKDTVGIFRDPDYDFRLGSISPVINKGRNDCNTLPIDIAIHDRIEQDTIDIGAFEYIHPVEPVALEQVEGHQLVVCNNIIINNVEVFSVNDMNTSGNNLLVDNNYIFKNNEYDYTLREHCAAVNVGVNTCCPLVTDLNEDHRIIWDTIDYGAFELNRLSDSTAFTVWVVEDHQLQLCNNIIINNGGSFAVSDANVSGSNLLVDHDDVFRHNVSDYRLRENSIAINAGINSCCSLALDINDEDRVFADTIDFGAFEQNISLNDSVYAVQQVEGHHLQLCNNIIINNTMTYATNVLVESNNLITDSEDVFVDSRYNFSPRLNSLAVNQGSNVCCPLVEDISQQSRVYEGVIDIGAFEPRFEWDTAIALLGEEGTPLVLCNNIIINNKYSKNLNVLNFPVNNIVTDNDTLFADNHYNYQLRLGSVAVNHGSNECVAWMQDVKENPRIFEEIVDIGAYEQYFEEDIFAAVLDSDTDGLVLCNNIIINNRYAQNVNVANIPANNIVTDNDTLFRNSFFDYTPRATSSAVNHGDNDCADWAKDMATDSRIFAEIIDIGAYEVAMDSVFEFYAVNTSDEDGNGPNGGGDNPSSGSGDNPDGGSDSTSNASKLKLYNNIVIHNLGHTLNVGGGVIGSHNLLDDTPNVFVDEEDNYSLKLHSPAIDAGDNQCVSWATDIKDDPRIACANIVDQGAYEFSLDMVELALTAVEVETENCQGYYIELTATEGALHYQWSHSNEDTTVVQVSPLIPTEYTVIASNGGECSDTASVYVVPSAVMLDSLGAPASVGTTFWLSYLRNHFRPPTLTLNISAEEACTGTISNPRTGWAIPFAVGNHSVTTVSVPLTQAYPDVSDAVGDFGLLVETTDSVSLYAANYNVSSFDVTDVLPVDALSDEYVLQTYTPMMNAEFVIVATEDSTWVDITPSRALQGGHPAQQTFNVMLHQGQTYLGMSQFGGTLGDLSGTVIHAHGNKPVAVFNGNVCALVPASNSYTDHLVEQAVGTNYWGRSFSITTTESQNFDVVRVTAMRNNTEVRRNGTVIATLQAYQTHEFQINGTDGSCYLETSEPAGVYLYIAGAVQGNPQERSDPSMIWIPPTEQMLSDITFATFNSPGISDHYVNIVIPAAAVDEVTLDGIPIGGQFTLLNGNSAYAYARKHIANGTHRLHCNGGFIAHCYGLGFHESYGYAAGSKAVPLKEQLFVNGILNTELPLDTKFCPYEPIDFSTYVNYPCDSVVWNFGDGTPTVSGFAATHGYEEPGNYTVAATLYITSNGAVFCSNLYAWVRVVPAPTITYYDTVCQGVSYQLHGFEVPPTEAGHYTFTRTEVAVSGYCDSIFVLELEVRDNYLLVEDTICLGNSYTDYGFNITPSETGVYIDTINAGTGSFGCDSLVILQLSVTPNTDNPPAIEGEGWPCQGGTYTYSIDSLSELTDVVWTVPDSLIVMPGEDPYSITLLFGVYADSMQICVTATGGCGELSWCRTIWPQPYSHVQIYDTLCDNVTEYIGYGFVLTDVSDTNDIFIKHDTAAGGCDSTTVLSLVFMPTYQVSDTIVICESEYPYLYHDTLLADTGFYQITLSSVFGCDSVVSLVMQSMPVHHTYFYDTVCNAKTWYDSIYTLSGDYDVMLENVYGCDSLVTMHLTVYYSDTVAVDSAVCRNMLPIEWNGLIFADARTQTVLLENMHDCDSMVVMTLQVKELTSDTINVYVLENDLPTYSLNGYSYDSSGVYTQLLTNAAGCDSTLIVNLTVLSNVSNTVDDTICESELPFTWNGVTFTEAGTQYAVLEASSGVDSLVVMNVSVIPTTYGTFDTAIVENDLPYLYNDSMYVEAGIYTQNLTNAAGCDSILTLTLTVFPNITEDIDSTVCESELPIVWNDSLFTAAGVKETTILAHTGADSTITMTLTVISTTYGTFDTAIVENDLPYHYNDSTYFGAGSYTQNLTNAAGCDSILTLNLTVYPNVTKEIDSAVCETALPLIWNDSVFTAAGVKETTILASTGADSTITMTVTVIPTTYGTFDTAIVENELPYHYNDSTYFEAGIYTQNLTNTAGCDSILTLTLTVYPNVTFELDSTICESALPLTWNDSIFTEAGVKETTILAHTGADSTITMTLTVIPTTYGTFDTAIVENELPYHYNDITYFGAGIYTQNLTNTAGCDSILTLTLTVYPNVTSEFDSAVCETAFPIIWNDSVFTEAGVKTTTILASTGADSTITMTVTEIPTTYGTFDTAIVENELPYHYNDSIYVEAGIYTQNLTNTAGCDSILTITLTVLPNVTEAIDSTVCESELPIVWNDSVFMAAGVKTTTILSTTGADSIITMTLTVIPTTYGTFDTAIVENELPYQYNDSVYVEAGTYTQNLTNIAGCDSILTVTLTVFPNVTEAIDSTVCESELPIVWNDSVFTAAGVKTTTILAHTGADSTITMTLTVIPTTYGTIDTAIVENALPYQYNDSIYVEAGVYTQYMTNAAGCDSILTLNLTVYPNVTSEIDSTICETDLPLIWNDSVFTAAGVKTTTILAHTGADSTITMTLTVNNLVIDTIEATACDSYMWNGTTYTQSGDYIQTFTAANGCDSVVTLHLNVNQSVTEQLEVAIVQNDLPYHYVNGQIDTTFAVGTPQLSVTHFSLLTANGCDSTVTLNLTIYQNVTNQVDTTVCAADLPYTWHGHSFTAAGSHTVTLLTSHGADSTVTYHLSVDNITANIGNITHITCYGESTGAATATVTGGQTPMTYAWTNASGTSVATTTSISNRPAGAYTFTVTDHLGCTATATVTLNTLNGQLTPGTIADNQVVCDGEMIPAFTGTTASGGNNGAYQWQISTNGTDWTPAPGTNNAQTYTYPNPAANAFTLRRAWVSQSCGTVYSNTVTVEVAPNSSDTITAEVCQGEPYQENGFDITADQTTEAGNYMYEQHYATGHCDSAVILLLTVWPTASELVEATVCEGDGYSSNGFEISPLETIGVGELQRELTLQTVHGCDSVVRLTLTVIDTAIRIVPLTADFCDNMSMELMVETGMPDYEWSTGETGPTITVTAAGNYSVTATEGGCTATAGYRVEGCQFELVLPNAITPSDFDGVNDYFALPEFFLRDISLFEIAIFNRWGEMVYYSTDKAFRWNGEYRGEIQYQTIYNYVIKYTDTAGRPHRRVGSITVL